MLVIFSQIFEKCKPWKNMYLYVNVYMYCMFMKLLCLHFITVLAKGLELSTFLFEKLKMSVYYLPMCTTYNLCLCVPSGRVARAGRSGSAFSLVSPDEMPFVLDLHLFLGRSLKMVTSNTQKGQCKLGFRSLKYIFQYIK